MILLASFCFKRTKLFLKCFVRARVFKVQTELMPAFLHQFADLRVGIGTFPEKYVSGFAALIE